MRFDVAHQAVQIITLCHVAPSQHIRRAVCDGTHRPYYPPCGEAMGRWQPEGLTEGLSRYRRGPPTPPSRRAPPPPPPHRQEQPPPAPPLSSPSPSFLTRNPPAPASLTALTLPRHPTTRTGCAPPHHPHFAP